MNEFVRERLDPRYALQKAIAGYDQLAATYRDRPPLTEAIATALIESLEAQARYIDSIYAKCPQLLFERHYPS